MKQIEELQQLIEKEITKLHFGDHPKKLYEPITYILSLGGKRMRPLLVLLSYQLFKKDLKQIIRPALATEVFHNFTLMHDDIMDEAPIRRGKPTVHEKWDQTVAILSGDAMLVKGYDLILELDPAIIPTTLKLFNKTAVEVCEGQQIDMNFESASQVSEAQYLEMIRLKTAVLLGFSLQFGGLMAQVNSSNQQLLYNIGEAMGLAFQLMDDLLDVYGDQDKFGKKVGGDIVANKKTFLLIKALELAVGDDQQLLNDWIIKASFDHEEKVNAVTTIYDRLGIRNTTVKLMNSYFDKAIELIQQLDADEDGITLLRQFVTQLMNRES